MSGVESKVKPFDRSTLDQMLAKRFFYAPSFQIYGGVSGLYDYGPPGTALQANIISLWRSHFVLEEDMLELDCSMITPEIVLKTSGHVDKFSDYMVKDLVNGDIYRADHLVEGWLQAQLDGDKLARSDSVNVVEVKKDDGKKEKKTKKKALVVNVKLSDEIKSEYESILNQIDNFNGEQLGEIITKYGITSPDGGNAISQPKEFNLMFETAIGPSGNLKGYLRPETAQGQFVNFKKLLEYNNDKVPFASALIGKSFRNEISPRAGLLRVREFTMAEIEHFVDPLDKSHPRFQEVKDIKLRLLKAEVQMNGGNEIVEMTIGDAVQQGVVDNETLGYFLVRIYQFLLKVGIDASRLRFRQHMNNEMAHYASDCWDGEILTSYGWIECVGCADRSAYDLSVHAAKTKEKLIVRQALEQPKIYSKTQATINKKKFGGTFKKDAKIVEKYLDDLDLNGLEELRVMLESKCVITGEDGNQYELTNDLVKVETVEIKEHIREFVPNVIEPSFGIGRILYSLLEHSFYTREGDEMRGVLSFPTSMAPTKCLVLPISNKPEYQTTIQTLLKELRKLGIASKLDDSAASIGRRYARNDELGTPFAITLDPQTTLDNTITLRERDTCSQIRAKIDVILNILHQLVTEKIQWAQVVEQYGLIDQIEEA